MAYTFFPPDKGTQSTSRGLGTPANAMRQFNITREGLHNSLEERVAYLKSFIDFGNKDIGFLGDGAKYIAPLVPAVANIVYHKLLRYSLSAQVFIDRELATRQEKQNAETEPERKCPFGFGENKVSAAISESSPQLRRRKLFLRSYLRRLVTDYSRPEFWHYLDRVGMLHAGLDSKNPLHIEYTHSGILLGMIQDTVTQAIIAHPRMPARLKAGLVSAVGKLIWIQNDLMARWHVDDGDDVFDRKAAISAQREKEERRAKYKDPSFTTPVENDGSSTPTSDKEMERQAQAQPVPVNVAVPTPAVPLENHQPVNMTPPSVTVGRCPVGH